MIFIVTYKCKEGHIHEVPFEPNEDDIINYFLEVKNLTITKEQLKYLDLEKIQNTDEFSNWLSIYASKECQKSYDDFYKERLDYATEKLSDISDFDSEIEKIMQEGFLPTCAKTTLKRRFNKMQKEKGDN